MSTEWPSDISKGRNWFANDRASTNRADTDHPATDTRLADIPTNDASITGLATAQTHIAALFQNIRQVLDRSRLDIASQLRTTPQVIEYLETGKFTGLPEWTETTRIVSAYTKLVGIDPAPALHVLKTVAQTQPRPVPQTVKTVSPKATVKAAVITSIHVPKHPTARSHAPFPPFPAPDATARRKPAAHSVSDSQPIKWRRGRSGTPVPTGTIEAELLVQGEPDGPAVLSKAVGARLSQTASALAGSLGRHTFPALVSLPGPSRKRTLLLTGGATLLCLVTVVAALSSTAVVRFIHPYFPAPFATAILGAHNVLSPPRVYQRDGMRWLEVADPRLRRTDKLPVPEE